MGGNMWSDAELSKLDHLYAFAAWPAILSGLPGRSPASIRCQAVVRSIKRTINPRVKWTGPELQILRRMWVNASKDDICKTLPRHPWMSIGKMANDLGVRRDPAMRQSTFALIRQLRAIRRKKMTQAELARRIGIAPPQVAKWERGEQLPRLRSFFDWVEALGFKIELSSK